jgi:hypothetical protein
MISLSYTPGRGRHPGPDPDGCQSNLGCPRALGEFSLSLIEDFWDASVGPHTAFLATRRI